MTQRDDLPLSQQCTLPNCTDPATDPSRAGALCIEHAPVTDTSSDKNGAQNRSDRIDNESETHGGSGPVNGDERRDGATDTDQSLEPFTWDHSVAPTIEPGVYPEDLQGVAQWLTWKPANDGRKIPRAPYANPDWPDKFVDAQEPEVWTEFDTAAEWANKCLGHNLAFNIRDRAEFSAEEFVLIDYDDARDPETEKIHPLVWEHIERAGSYTDVSTSGTGVHIFARGELPDGVKAIDADLPDVPGFRDAEIEVYDSARFSAMTGDHIDGTPRNTTDCQPLIDDLADEYATVAEGMPDEMVCEPEKPRHEIADLETTTDIQDVFDAIQHTTPRDIRLRSTVTHERGDGTLDMDPSWASSKSGTRLAQVDEMWVYRKGMHGLDALQVVALEERIITRPDEYPTGEEFWNAVDALRERGAHIPNYESLDEDPVSTLPLARLDCLDRDDARRYARKRDMDWPTTDEARAQLRDQLRQTMRHEEEVVIDAPTSLGKSATTAREPWLNHADVTGDKPVVHFSETREARDEALAESKKTADVTSTVLRGRKEACPVAAGKHDPATDDEDDPDIVATIDGRPASKWLDAVCDGRGYPFSGAHAYLAEYNDQGIDLPCCEGDAECPTKAQWEGVPTDEDGDPTVDVIHATHQFAHVPSLRCGNVILDECPDFTADLGTDRVQRAVTAYLEAAGAPVTTWEAFVILAQHDGIDGDAARERDVTQKTIREYEPDREWYLTADGAHTLAPALTRAIWLALRGDSDVNGRRAQTVPHAPPRLDADARDDAGWNRTWVTVVLDDTNRVRTVRAAPDFSKARCVIGLDAHPSMLKWQRNATPSITADPLLDPEERRLWRRFERGLTVVQVGDNVNPFASGEYYNELKTRAVLAHLHDHYGAQFSTAITAKSVERDHEQLMREVGINGPITMHFGEEKSRNDFADEGIGLVNGSIDPGDDYILDLLAECDLNARPKTVTNDDGTEHRARGREFVGPDSDAAANILASVRENHVAQAAGRYARNAADPDDRAVVFVRTDALPTGYADLQVPGVEWVTTDTQCEIIDALRNRPNATAAELAAATDVSKRHVAQTLARLVDAGAVECREGAGDYGADVYRALAGTAPATTGLVDLEPTDDIVAQITNNSVWDSYTWAFAISSPERFDSITTTASTGGSDDTSQSLVAFNDEPPPN